MTDSLTNPRHAAGVLAASGRKGDDVLVHMNRAELRGLEAMHGKSLTTNPTTGMPEAFGLGGVLGILGTIGGLVAAPFTGGSSLLLSSLGGALGGTAGGLLEGKDFGSALGGGILSGLLGYGAGSALGGLASAGVDAAAKEGVQALANNGVQAATLAPAAEAAQGIGGLSDFGWGASGLGEAAAGATPISLTQPGADAISRAAIERAGGAVPMEGASGWAGLQNQMSNVGRGLQSPEALWNTFGRNGLSTTAPIAAGLYGMGMNDAPPTTQGPFSPQPNYPRLPGPNQRRYTPAPANWDYSTGREWNYFTPAFKDGGSVRNFTRAESDEFRRNMPQHPVLRYGPQLYDIASGRVPGYAHMQQEAEEYIQRLGAYHDTFGDDVEKWSWQNRNNIPDGDDVRHIGIDRGDYVTPVGGGGMGEYMPSAFADGGSIRGPGGGLDDAIPAIIDGRQPAKLSSGEYVVPAHAVSALGNGSTEDGVRQLDGMVNKTMMAKYGRKPKAINPKRMMPRGLGAMA